MDNFNCPYLSSSLSQSFEKMAYFTFPGLRTIFISPLGGNRKEKLENILILMIVFGKWTLHGAKLGLMLSGGLNGI